MLNAIKDYPNYFNYHNPDHFIHNQCNFEHILVRNGRAIFFLWYSLNFFSTI